MSPTSRRHFVKNAAITAAGMALAPKIFSMDTAKNSFQISLAEWSLHKALFAKQINNLDFPGIAKKTYGINIVEYVNQFFKDKAEDTSYLNDLLKRCKDNGVKNHLIMIDGEGGMAELDEKTRVKAVENHYKWVNAAKYLGCKTIRVNAYGVGSRQDVHKAAVGGLSSDGQWLSGVMKEIHKKNVGTLPELGNFCLKRGENNTCAEEYDRYKGTAELLPFAKGVSAKTHDFDEKGNCVETDYYKMMNIIKAAGFKGYIGIEYEGSKLTEEEGIKKTKILLEKVAKSTGYKIA